jgi:hypothetical protein
MLLRCESLEPHVSEWDGPAVLMPLTGFDGASKHGEYIIAVMLAAMFLVGIDLLVDSPRSAARHRAFALHAYQIKVKAKTPARRWLPDRKRSADIIDRCAEYTEREAAANQGEQHRPIPRGRSFACQREACWRSGPS